MRQLPATLQTPVPTMQMKTQFAFGKNGIEVAVPEGFEYQVIRSRSAKPLSDVQAALESALEALRPELESL